MKIFIIIGAAALGVLIWLILGLIIVTSIQKVFGKYNTLFTFLDFNPNSQDERMLMYITSPLILFVSPIWLPLALVIKFTAYLDKIINKG